MAARSSRSRNPIAGAAYYVEVYLPQQRAIVEAQAEASAKAAADARSAAKAHAQAEAAAARRAQLVPQLAEQVRRLQSTKPGSRAEHLAREDAIVTALQMDPPEIPPNAQALFNRGQADLKAAATATDYHRAAAELSRALRVALGCLRLDGARRRG